MGHKPLPPPPGLWLPRPKRWGVWAIGVSLVLHGLMFLIKINPWLVPPPRRPTIPVVLVPPGTETPGPPDIRFEFRGGSPPAQRGPTTPAAPRENPLPVLPETRPAITEQRPTEPSPLVAAPPAAVPPADSGRGRATRGDPGYRIGPALGEGKLWVQPLPASPREIAEAVTRSHLELVDSAVSAIVQRYIDSVLNAPADPGAAPPSWTTKIMGKTFGLDSKYIYLGPLKIPSALLAFLPINGGGMTMEFSKANRMAAIRADLIYAAQRSATLDDFKRAVRELRAERERQRELERNQRKSPSESPKDTTKKVVPPKIP